MKFIRNHLAFILPMMAILLGIEFLLVFDRTTSSYEERLREGYSMFIVAKKPITLEEFQNLNRHISQSGKVDKERLAQQISDGITQSNAKEILKALPHFYNLKLDGYLSGTVINEIKKDLEQSPYIKKVETFGNSYKESYRLFSFIKFLLKFFIGFMTIISLFLIVKQMEIWRYTHQERMQVMKIFGASLMLRSGVLFRVAIIDAVISSTATSSLFVLLKYRVSEGSQMEILSQKQDLLFQVTDSLILLAISILIVVISVSIVVLSHRE